jgi:DNA-binding transcriptional MerR regulator
VRSQTAVHRPVDLAREHGLSTQAVRNYERDGFLPPAERTPSGYRAYTAAHARALRAYLALVAAHGYATAGEVMRAVHRGDLDAALTLIDLSHLQRRRDRETLAAVEKAVDALDEASLAAGSAQPLSVGHLAHRLGVSPATLRKWERAGVLTPRRDPRTGQRQYDPADVRDAQLAHLLRRGGYLLVHIATVVDQVRGAGGTAPLADSLHDWQQRLTTRGRLALTAAGLLAAYLDDPAPAPAPAPSSAKPLS